LQKVRNHGIPGEFTSKVRRNLTVIGVDLPPAKPGQSPQLTGVDVTIEATCAIDTEPAWQEVRSAA
jgi:hypothetical protein